MPLINFFCSLQVRLASVGNNSKKPAAFSRWSSCEIIVFEKLMVFPFSSPCWSMLFCCSTWVLIVWNTAFSNPCFCIAELLVMFSKFNAAVGCSCVDGFESGVFFRAESLQRKAFYENPCSYCSATSKLKFFMPMKQDSCLTNKGLSHLFLLSATYTFLKKVCFYASFFYRSKLLF